MWCVVHSTEMLPNDVITEERESIIDSWIAAIISDDLADATEILNKASAELRHLLLDGKLVARQSNSTQHAGIHPGLVMTQYCPETAW